MIIRKRRGKPKYLGEVMALPNGARRLPIIWMVLNFAGGNMHTLLRRFFRRYFRLRRRRHTAKIKTARFVKQAMQVYNKNKNLTKDEKTIATYWDDNPFVVQHNGHMMFADKKITPGGHWIGITTIACKKTHANAVKTAQAYALTSIALFDAFIMLLGSKI